MQISRRYFVFSCKSQGFKDEKRLFNQNNHKKAGDNKNCFYQNWDRLEDREIILSGQTSVAAYCKLDTLTNDIPLIIFDEIHQFGGWKNFLKVFFDHYQDKFRIIVTGSSRLSTFKKGGDSLMGRYFPYQLHPLTLAEISGRDLQEDNDLHSSPLTIEHDDFEKLLKFGGFPEPWLKANTRFYNQWKRLRHEQFFKEDIRDLTRIQEVDFLVVKNDKPWILVEVKKSGNKSLSEHLAFFQRQTGAEYAFQVTEDLPFVNRNCFEIHEPVKVPLLTFLSQFC